MARSNYINFAAMDQNFARSKHTENTKSKDSYQKQDKKENSFTPLKTDSKKAKFSNWDNTLFKN